VTGLAFRSYSNFLGDFLWACLIFFIFSFLFYRAFFRIKIAVSLLYCYTIEISQLFHFAGIDVSRKTKIGALILGHGVFGWRDIMAYTLAIMISSFVLYITNQKRLRE
jgi:hypothetical protein